MDCYLVCCAAQCVNCVGDYYECELCWHLWWLITIIMSCWLQPCTQLCGICRRSCGKSQIHAVWLAVLVYAKKAKTVVHVCYAIWFIVPSRTTIRQPSVDRSWVESRTLSERVRPLTNIRRRSLLQLERRWPFILTPSRTCSSDPLAVQVWTSVVDRRSLR